MNGTKYHNKKIVIDGIIFDSKKEGMRYKALKSLEKNGKIQDLQLQVKFVLIPSQKEFISGKERVVERECSYIADFVYTQNGCKVVEDVKGMRTAEYIIKRKLMLYVYKIKIKEL